jgi:hypothetical protein
MMTMQQQTPPILSPPLPSEERALNHVINTLELHGATVTLPGSNSSRVEQVIYVNHSKVLLRFQYTQNTHVPIELLHEVPGNRWVRSWGLTSDADHLLYVTNTEVETVRNNHHYWFHLATLRELTVKRIVQNKVQMMNNSQRTRELHGVTSNVMNVWVSAEEDADYIQYDTATRSDSYTSYLEQFIGRER